MKRKNKKKDKNIHSKAYRFRLYPTEEQENKINQNIGSARFIYNKMLEDKINYYSEHKKSLNNTPAQYKNEYEFLKEVDSQALVQSGNDLNTAYTNFFEKRANFPKFKKKGVRDTYRSCVTNNNIRLEDDCIKLPKIGLVKINMERQLPKSSKIKNVTVTKTKTNKYFVSINFEYYKKIEKVTPKSYIGLDYSPKHMYIDSNGDTPGVPKPYKQYEEKLAKEQRKLSRMIYGSNNYKKQQLKINKIYEKVTNIRKDFAHKISRKIANSYDVVCVEDINLVELSKQHRNADGNQFKLGKTNYDNGWGMTRNMIEYKMNEEGKYFIKANKWFPSTKTCSSCGAKKDMKIDEREYVCECGMFLDRDLNAALNLRKYGIEQVAQTSI